MIDLLIRGALVYDGTGAPPVRAAPPQAPGSVASNPGAKPYAHEAGRRALEDALKKHVAASIGAIARPDQIRQRLLRLDRLAHQRGQLPGIAPGRADGGDGADSHVAAVALRRVGIEPAVDDVEIAL